MNRKRLIPCLFLATSVLLGGCQTLDLTHSRLKEKQKVLSQKQITQIAHQAVDNKGYNLEIRTLIYDEGNSKWKEKFEHIGNDIIVNNTFMTDDSYQAVCFALTAENHLGGDIWIFIDKVTGEVMPFYVEK